VPGSWADGEQAIRAFLRENGIDDSHYVVADGSGLSEINKVTSRLLTDLLAVMFSRPDGEIYRDSLAKGGVNGTLEKRFAGLNGHVFAKTGSINGVRTLSGYVKTYGGDWLAFSILYNDLPADPEPHIALIDEAVRLLVYWPNLPDQLPPTTQPTRERQPQSAPTAVR
jgi:serine-type D-Ala-D-Ala carboxypeptidase/endopeptidase (penicillin-binding protein 4)